MNDVENLVSRLFPESDSENNQERTENVKFFLAGKNVTTAQIASQMSAAMERQRIEKIKPVESFDAHLKTTEIDDLLI